MIWKNFLAALLLGLALAWGITGNASTAGIEAETQRLAQDFQSGKIDLPTFQKRITELQNRAIQQNTTPEQRELMRRQQQQGQTPTPDMERLMPQLQRDAAAGEDMRRWQQTHQGRFDVAFPASIAALAPTCGKYQKEHERKAWIDSSASEARVEFAAGCTRPVPNEDRADGLDIRIEIQAINPKWKISSFGSSRPAEDLPSGSGVRSFTWGAGKRTQDKGGFEGAYSGRVANGSVSFLLHIDGSLTSIAEMDGIADKLATAAGQDCTWAALAKE
ncbi:MAG: hypothetical protein LBU43_03325 [Candidatus Accumulibacter sp.]|jgi:hypothetical protein|nr:hypothetical protein [Accumulibacter sp.]